MLDVETGQAGMLHHEPSGVMRHASHVTVITYFLRVLSMTCLLKLCVRLSAGRPSAMHTLKLFVLVLLVHAPAPVPVPVLAAGARPNAGLVPPAVDATTGSFL